MNEQARKRLGIVKYDAAENLRDEEDVKLYLQACLDEAGTDAAYVAHAIGTAARSQGMASIASRTGLGRESLYKSLSGSRTPSFDTVLKVLDALGLGLDLKRKNGHVGTPKAPTGKRVFISHARSYFDHPNVLFTIAPMMNTTIFDSSSEWVTALPPTTQSPPSFRTFTRAVSATQELSSSPRAAKLFVGTQTVATV